MTATEVSQSSVDLLTATYGTNPNFRCVLDLTGDLSSLPAGFYSLISFCSVLHHIPDYMGVMRLAFSGHLEKGGSLVSLEDPLWYSRMGRSSYLLNRSAYFAWRIGRGQLRTGFHSVYRRLTKQYDLSLPNDMVEYHVVRNGVDEEAIADALRPLFEEVRIIKYWSTQSAALQTAGERLGAPSSSFALVAVGYLGFS